MSIPDHWYKENILPWDDIEQKARLLVNEPQAVAWAWLHAYLENLNNRIGNYDGDGITFDELMTTADSHQGGAWGEYIVRGGVFEGFSTDISFWDHYRNFRCVPSEETVDEASFFSCSC